MTRGPAFDSFLLNAALWAQRASSPNSGAGTPAGAGSIFFEAGNYPATPAEVYLNLPGTPFGWIRQNLVNLKIYNVMNAPFNAVGNGIADDTAAINAAVTQAEADGGGIIYFPAPHIFRITKPAANLGSIFLSNQQNLIFMGDGPASQVNMIGSAGGGSWDGFRMLNGTHRIGFYNFHMDGIGITNPDGTSQNHLIQIAGRAGDPNGGSHDIDLVGMYFGQTVGDATQNVGEAGEVVYDIRFLYNNYNLFATNGSRSAAEAQRYTQHIQFMYCWATGSHDQLVDFEPTGGSGLDTAGPQDWNIAFNHLDGSGPLNPGGITVTLSGASNVDPTHRIHFCYNNVFNGDGIEGGDLGNTDCRGNIVISNTATSNSVFGFIKLMNDLMMVGNIGISLNAAGNKKIFSFTEQSGGDPFRIMVNDNICRSFFNSVSGGSAIAYVGGKEQVANGNIVWCDSTTANQSIAIGFASTALVSGDHAQADGNLIIATTQNLRAGIDVSTSGTNFANTHVYGNLVDGTVSGSLYSRGGLELFTNWRTDVDNNYISTLHGAELPATNVGVSMEGVGGPGTQIATIALAAGPSGNVAAPQGSLCMNESGVAPSILFYKETGVGVSGGTAGWLPFGASLIGFAAQNMSTLAATLFLAPGMGLAVVSATEIKVPCPRPGTIRNLRIKQVPGTGAGTISYTFRINGVDKISFGIAFTASVGNINSSVTVAAGDLLSCRQSKSAAAATAPTFGGCYLDLC